MKFNFNFVKAKKNLFLTSKKTPQRDAKNDRNLHALKVFKKIYLFKLCTSRLKGRTRGYLSDLKRADKTKLTAKLIKQELIRGKKM